MKTKRYGETTIPCPGLPESRRYWWDHQLKLWYLTIVNSKGIESKNYETYPHKSELLKSIDEYDNNTYNEMMY